MNAPVWSIDKWKEKNADSNLPTHNAIGSLIVIGCNYHTTWQSNKRMRFVLTEVKGDKARLQTRRSRKNFWTDLKDLVFIDTNYNKSKAKELRNDI